MREVIENMEASVRQGLQYANWGAQDRVGLLVLATILGALTVLYLLLRKPGSGLRLPPGPRPWPVIGNLLLLGELPHQSLAYLAKKYGPLMYLRLGTTHTVIVSSPDVAREFLKTHDQVFANRPYTLASNILTAKNTDLVFANGSHWRHLRKMCLLELFTQKRLESFRAARTEELTTMMKSILEESQEGKAVDLNFKLWSLTANNMTRMLMNKRYFGSELEGQQEGQSFKILFEKILYWFGLFFIGDFNPALRWVDKLQGVNASMRKLGHEVGTFYQQLIDEHRQAATHEGGTSASTTDFIDVLLSMPSEDGKEHLSDETIGVVIQDMLIAGADTSSVTAEWAMAELLRRPDAMKRVQAELDAVVGTTRLVQESDIPHLQYLQAVAKETFRLHPAVPLMVPHESSEACQVAGYNLPSKTRLLINVWAIGRDPATWEGPLTFEPERFLDHPELDVKGQNFELLPFGSGRRGCAGLSLGLLMVHMALARLLHSFNWSLPNQQDPNSLDMSEKFTLTAGRAQPLHVVAKPRLAAHLYE